MIVGQLFSETAYCLGIPCCEPPDTFSTAGPLAHGAQLYMKAGIVVTLTERRSPMYLKQGDLFWGMNKEFVKDAMGITTKENMEEGQVVFKEGEPAESFYILVKGRIKLTLGEKSREVYVAYQPGEIIGWSSLIGREALSATAHCLEPTILSKVDRKRFLQILEKYPAEGATLFQRVAAMLGNRLVKLYPSIA
jgi:CRP/FNR family cyclic AMP-dependent transcriptional regulator